MKLDVADWFVHWQFSAPGAIIAGVLALAYGLGWLRARGKPGAPGIGRAIGFYLGGILTLLYVTCGPVGYYSHELMWMFTLQVAVLAAITPLGFALGKPLELIEVATGRDVVRRILAGKFGRALMFPLVSSIFATASLIAVFYSGYGQAALDSTFIEAVLILHMLIAGVLVVLPLLTDDLLPGWATPPVKALLACVDGLLDALPGILLMTASGLLMPKFPGFHGMHPTRGDLSATLDQRYAGGALIAVAEAIGIPLLIAVFIEWMRADESQAKANDKKLDEQWDGEELTTTPWWINKE